MEQGARAVRRDRAGGDDRGRVREVSAPLALWLDGALVDPTRPAYAPLERGLTYGDGLFETLAVVDGRALDADDHLARLAASARALGFPEPDPRAIQDAIAACLGSAADAAGGSAAGALRVTWTRGPGGRGFAPGEGDGPPRLAVALFAPRPDAATRSANGVRAASVSDCAPGELAAHKSVSALHYVVAASRARAAGADEALLVDERGRVLETAGANVFVSIDGIIVTPPASLPILPGLTRRRVLAELGPRDAVERAFDLGSVVRAEEAFLTNSVEGIVPLVAIDGRAIGRGEPGPRTQALRESERARRAQAPVRSS
jgi:branched-chain amino acid aminotransferase